MTTTENTIMMLLGPTTGSAAERLRIALDYTRAILSELESALNEWEAVEQEILRIGDCLRTSAAH